VIITLVFEKNVIFFAENWQNSQKIVIITSTPDWAKIRHLGDIFVRWAHFFLKNMILAQFFQKVRPKFT
jgi:hypothetical protein